MWALTYDYLISYSMEDMSPEPGLAESWETSEDGLTWTFTLRDDAVFSDGEPLTSADVKHTYDRIIDGGPEASSWGSYLTSVTEVEAPDDTTVVLTLEKPNAVLPLLPIPILPEHVWSDISEEDVEDLRQRAQRRQRGRRVGPVPPRRGHRRRVDVPLRGEPRLLEGRAARRRGRLPRLQERGHRHPGAHQGRDRLRREHQRPPGGVAAGARGHHRDQRRLPGLRRDRLQRRRHRPRDRRAAGRRAPGAGRQGLPPRARLRPRPRRDHREGLPGRRHPRRLDHPAGLLQLPLGAVGGRGLHLRPREGRPAADRGRLRARSRRRAAHAGRFTAGRAAALRPLGEHHVADHLGVLLRVARRPRHRRQGHRHGERQAHPGHHRRRVRHVRVGLVRRARPRLDAELPDLRPARQLERRVVLQRGVRRPLRRAERRPRRRAPGSRRSSRCSRSSSRTRPTWSPPTTPSGRPSAPTASPASSPSPTPAAS